MQVTQKPDIQELLKDLTKFVQKEKKPRKPKKLTTQAPREIGLTKELQELVFSRHPFLQFFS